MSVAPRPERRSVALPETTPRIALVGCGAIADTYYLPVLTRHPKVLDKLVLVDREQARAEKLAAKFNVRRCRADYREVLNESDGVILALPIGLHYPVAMEFLSRGVNVLCEKPLAESADKARAMVEQARRRGAVLATGYLQRLWPQFAKVKELLSSQSLGKPRSIRYEVGEVFDWPTASGFYFNGAVGTRGVLRDRGAHVFDHICWWLGGKPTVISSQNDSFGGSEALAQVEFEYRGCTGRVKLSWLCNTPCRFAVEGEAGAVEGEVYDFTGVSLRKDAGRKERVALGGALKTKSDVGDKIVTNFINVIVKGEQPLIAGEDVLESIEFIDECYTSAKRLKMPWYDGLEVTRES